MAPLRIIYMGTPDFALPALKALYESDHEVVAVYCQPPRPAGRGHKLRKSVIQEFAEKNGLPVEMPASLRSSEAQEKFASYQADIAVVAAYGLILPKAILEAPKYGCINIHGSILPRWRGAAPVHRAIQEGDKNTGITIMQMDEGLDTGPMLMTRELPLTEKSTTPEVYAALALMGGDMILEAIEGVAEGTLLSQPQPSEGVTYANKVSKEESRINWGESADEIERKVRAFVPFPGIWFELKGERIKIFEARVIDQQGEPGCVSVTESSLIVACGKKSLSLMKVQRSGSKPMEIKDFLRGFNATTNTQLIAD